MALVVYKNLITIIIIVVIFCGRLGYAGKWIEESKKGGKFIEMIFTNYVHIDYQSGI